ncbi:hypothetical protein M407DRAFT_32239 [Tulasnella calospora MUT 4182]|uniref:Uncharacterized protein n=1 Tax=Tulasnella calospora MUT 4182 TaxID=1051891 RepID=A0A0C3Q530_9AGAM|nr:hypothetical protein M407DRAFT_32239 [Tulasnella calospora MUT 4182]
MPGAATKAFSAAILHLALSVGNIMDLAPPKDRARAIENSPQGQPVLSGEFVVHLWSLAENVKLEEDLQDGDVNHLRLLGILLSHLFLGARYGHGKVLLRVAIGVLAKFTTSHQLLCTLTCAGKMYGVYRTWNSLERVAQRYERLSELFEFAKTAYEGRQDSCDVPFLLEALQLSVELCDGENRDRSEAYQICLDVLRHACQLEDIDLEGVFAPMGSLMRHIELHIRHPGIQRPYQEQLRGYKYQYVGILLRRLDGSLSYLSIEDLCESLAETLRYTRECAAAREPGHPENRVTLDLFRLLRVRLQQRARQWQVGYFEKEYEKFEAWVDMGGCAKTPGRINRDPELCWCPYIEV